MDMELLERYYRNKQFNEGLELVLNTIKELKEIGRLSAVKKLLNHLDDELACYIVIRYLDYGLLYQYSNFLARYAFKKFPSIWTLSWNIDKYVESGQALELQKQLEQRMSRGELKKYPDDLKEKIQFSYIQILLELKKFDQAETVLSDCRQETDVKWGYFYLENGNRDKAKDCFLQAAQHEETGYKSYIMLSMIEGMEGRAGQGLAFIEEGKLKFPNVPGLLMEEIRRYRDLREFEKMMQRIEQLESITPEHFYRPYLLHLKADYYYEIGNMEKLHSLLESPILIDSPYRHINQEGARKTLNINPVIQKSNYCVPACLQMLMSYHGDDRHQDEIAAHIFTGTGSTMPHTVAYWESVGYECLYIGADLSTIKQCVDHGLPILLCVDIELASHVQIITGYDDQIGVILIQDPNLSDTLKITYEDYEKTYYMTSYLGIVGVKANRRYSTEFLSKEDNVYYRQLYHYSELLDEDAEKHMPEMLSFLQENVHHSHTNLYIIKHLHDIQAKGLFDHAVETLERNGVQHDTVYLHIGDGYLAQGDIERAESIIEKVGNKQHNGFYCFLKGRICYEKDDYEGGILYFKAALKQDYEHQLTWSYLSLCYGFNGDMQNALDVSYQAYDSETADLFIVMNHCKILLDNHLNDEALEVLKRHQEEHGQEAVYAYTLGKVYHALGKLDDAIDWLKTAIQLEETVHYPYLLIADILELEREDVQGAEVDLLSGLEKANDKQELYCRLGALYLSGNRYEEALAQYERCMEQYPTYSFAYLKKSEVLLEMGKEQESKQQLLQMEQQFNEDVEFLINAGMLLIFHQNVDEGLRLLEKGIPLVENNWEDPLDEYCKTISEHSLFERGITLLMKESEKKGKLQFAYLAYKAMLLHEMDDRSWRETFLQSLDIKEHVFTHFQYGEALFQRGEYEEAKQQFAYCVEQNSQDVRYLMRLAEIADDEGEQEKELAYLKKIFEIDFMNLDSEYFFGLLDEKEIPRYIAKLEANQQVMHHGEGLNFVSFAYGAKGDVGKEQELVTKALQLDSENKDIIHHQIRLYMKNEQWKKAHTAVLEAIEKQGFNEAFFIQFAEIRCKLGKYLTSYDLIKKMPFTNEEKAIAYTICADFIQSDLLEEQEVQEAERPLFKKVIQKVSSSSSKFLKVTGCTLLYEKAISVNKSFKPAYISLAHLYESEDMPEEAVKVLTKLLQHEQSYDVMYNLALFHLQVAEEAIRVEKHINRAITVLEDVVRLYPDEPEATELLNRLYMERDETKE